MRTISRLLAVALQSFIALTTASATAWVPIEAPGNPCDLQANGCFGSVPNGYLISRYETTNKEYAAFLNAVASTDSNRLYKAGMSSSTTGGILQSGSPGSYTYEVVPSRWNWPVNYVDLPSAMRYANWMNNGKPTGSQDAGTTESGAYDMSGGFGNYPATREQDAVVFLPTEDEWYKAAYYDAVSMSYLEYPAGSDTPMSCVAPTPAPNSGNCGDWTYPYHFSSAGAYTGSASPFGTFDQGGNALELTETVDPNDPYARVARGGQTTGGSQKTAASYTTSVGQLQSPWYVGFRVARVLPEPGTGLLFASGLLLAHAGAHRRERSESSQQPRQLPGAVPAAIPSAMRPARARLPAASRCDGFS